MTRAALTPAAPAMARRPVSKPCRPNCSMAVKHRVASRRRFAWMSGEKCDSVSVRAGTARELVAHGGQQAVAERHQRGGEPLVLGDQPRCLADRRHLGVAGGRITRPAAQRGAVHDDDPARAQ